MALDISKLRAKAQAQAAKAQSQSQVSNTVFPFSSLNVGDSVRIRFIDDGEPNDVFWRERRTRVIPFNSVKQADGQVINNRCWVDVPAFNLKYNELLLSNLPENYLYKSEDDVIQAKIKGFWDMGDEGKTLYYKYGRKKTYIFQGFVRSDGYDKNKIYRFIVNEELFNLIKSFLTNDEIDTIPTDRERGLDFILNVTGKIANINGKPQEVKDYSTSTWSRKETPLTQEELASLETTPPFVLKDFIFARPSVEQERVMLEMFDASMEDESYDVVKWGKVFKPNNIFFDANGNIKDLKGGSNKPQEVPQAQPMMQQPVYQQPMYQQPVQQPMQQFVNPMMQGEVNFMNQMQQSMTQPMYAPQPIVQVVEQPMMQQPVQQTAPQLIKEHSETVSGQTPQDVIGNLMSKFAIQQN